MKKKPRLFVRSDWATDDVWWYCGGPVLEEMLNGLKNSLESAIDCAVHEFGTRTDQQEEQQEEFDLELKIQMMTDEEVAALPDI